MLMQDSNARCRTIQETQTSVMSTMKAKQEVIHIFRGIFNKNYPYVDLASYGSVSKIQIQNNHLCFQCLCASFYNTFTISDILMRYCFLLCNL